MTSTPLFPDAISVKILLSLVLLPSVFGICVALFAPNNILQLLPRLHACVDIMTTYLPFMVERIATSRIPQVLAVTYLIGWVFLPIQMILLPYCYFKYANTAGGFERLRLLGYRRWKMRLLVYCSLPVFVFGMTLNGDYHYLWIDPINTRIGLAIVGVFSFVLLNLLWVQALALTFMSNSDWEN